MIQDPSLLNDWYPVLSVQQLEAQNGLAGVRLLGEAIVIWKTDSQVHAWQDRCVHRGTRLSMGHICQCDSFSLSLSRLAV